MRHWKIEHRGKHQSRNRITDIHIPHWVRFVLVMLILIAAMSLDAHFQGVT